MTESEAVAAAKHQADLEGGSEGLQSTAVLVGPDYADDFFRKRYLGHWVVGFEGSDSVYTVDDATGKVGFVLIFAH